MYILTFFLLIRIGTKNESIISFIFYFFFFLFVCFYSQKRLENPKHEYFQKSFDIWKKYIFMDHNNNFIRRTKKRKRHTHTHTEKGGKVSGNEERLPKL